ncbi:hypothetical protein N7450_011620 [Penicillium hetheringtonii]|uniref:Uncharacterized protein n=1 Tax=Penicillium hetheringtonii TaxID=911720 RepID=A0AAD6GNU1_9EURO|nr:hypothetical protein N7450_011620 [Penicillium hetheringtonii]
MLPAARRYSQRRARYLSLASYTQRLETARRYQENLGSVQRNSPSIRMAARMFEEFRSILLAIKGRRGNWQNVSPALTVPMSDGITLLEHYHKCPTSTSLSTNYKSFEYKFLEAFQPTQYNVAESDIDRYFDTPTISTGFDIGQSQTEFIRNWWKINRLEFTCMAQVAQDHLVISAA